MTNEELVKYIRSGPAPDEMEQLYLRNLPFIRKLAQKYTAYAEMEDLMQEAYFGLYEAVQHYEESAEVLFLTYATFWIKQAMRRYVRSCCQSVRIPERMADKVYVYRRFIVDFCKYYGHEPPRTVICYHLGISEQSLRHIEKAASMGQIQSLDEPLKSDDELSLADTISSGEDMAGDVVEDVAHEELRRELWGLVDTLEGEQPEILRRRYIDGMTLQGIGKIHGVSPEYIRREESKALRMLRSPKKACRLRPYLTEQDIAAAYRGNGAGSFALTWTSSTERVVLHRMGQA